MDEYQDIGADPVCPHLRPRRQNTYRGRRQAQPVRGWRRRSKHLRIQRLVCGVHQAVRRGLRRQTRLPHGQLPLHGKHHRGRQLSDRTGQGANEDGTSDTRRPEEGEGPARGRVVRAGPRRPWPGAGPARRNHARHPGAGGRRRAEAAFGPPFDLGVVIMRGRGASVELPGPGSQPVRA